MPLFGSALQPNCIPKCNTEYSFIHSIIMHQAAHNISDISVVVFQFQLKFWTTFFQLLLSFSYFFSVSISVTILIFKFQCQLCRVHQTVSFKIFLRFPQQLHGILT